MTSIPANLTLIRDSLKKPGSLATLKAAMLAVATDYVMVVGEEDIVDVQGTLDGEVHYLATHIATRRAYRYAKPVISYDPLLLSQFNYAGRPILHQSIVPLFPTSAVEPWHTVMLRAQTQGAGIGRVAGNHTVIEPWPRPELSGAYAPYHYSFDPAAIMEAIPSIIVEDVNHRPLFRLRNPMAEAITAFCLDCSDEFVGSLAAPNVRVEVLLAPDFERVRQTKTNLVAYFESIEEPVSDQILGRLQLGLEFPGVSAVSPRLVSALSVQTYRQPAFSAVGGLISGVHPKAWLTRTRDLGLGPPSEGAVNTQAILREKL